MDPWYDGGLFYLPLLNGSLWSKLVRNVGRRRKLAATIVLIVSLSSFLSTYEVWRSSIEFQVAGQVDSMNITDYPCAYIINNSWVMNYFNGKIVFVEGGTINKTELADWRDVWNSAAALRNHLLASSQPCKIFFGLTRTYFILLGEQKEGPAFRTTVNMYFAKYAPF